MQYLKNLNNEQIEAVTHVDGPLLIVAGVDQVKKGSNIKNSTYNR